MTTWPATDGETRDALLQVQAILVQVRTAAWEEKPSAGVMLLTLADAVDDLVSHGLCSFERRLQELQTPQRETRPEPRGASAITDAEAVAFAKAIGRVIRDLASQTSEHRALATAVDQLEYLPSEFLRLGPAAICGLGDSREPNHIKELMKSYLNEITTTSPTKIYINN